MPDSICFFCAAPATETTQVPAAGWGSAYPQAQSFEAPACARHAPAPPDEPGLIAALIRHGAKKTPRPGPEAKALLYAELERLARALYAQVFEQPWQKPLVLVSNGLGVAPEAKDLYAELEDELKETIRDYFPEEPPHTKIDYHFFENESDQDADSVLWMRLPGGLTSYAWPGVL